MRVIAIAVVGTNGVIGDGHDQPFKFAEDWERFKATTMGHPMIMGRHTSEAIGRYLAGRTTIVVSRDPEQVELSDRDSAPSFAVGSLEMALELAAALDEVCFICGGGQVYRGAWEHLTELDLTEVHAEAPGTITFPEVDPNEWRELSREPRGEFDFVRYFPITRTENLTLVPVGPHEVDDWARLHSGPDLPEVSLERHRAGIAANVAHWLGDGLGYWLVRESLHDRPIGVAGVRRNKELPAHLWSLSYRFEQAARGRGLAEEVAREAIRRLAVVDPGAEVQALVRPGNESAAAVVLSVGLQPAGSSSDARGPLQVFRGTVSELT